MSQEKFIELITKEFLGELSPEEHQELQLLVKNDPAYAKERSNFKMYWASDRANQSDDQEMFEKITEKIRDQEPDFNVEQNIPLKKHILSPIWKAAVAILLLSIAVLWYKTTFHHLPDQANLNVVHTVSGETKELILADGTKVTINAASKLSFPSSFRDSTREVYLTGEAYFDVQKDRSHPFIIHTGKMDIRVLGTAFNVKAYANDKFSETTLIRGSVQVTLADRPKDRITLKPTEKLVVKYSPPVNQEATPVQEANALSAITYMQKRDNTVIETSWLEHKLIFKDEDFESLANSLERRYGVHIQFQDENIKDLRFTGIFERESIAEVLTALQLIEAFKFRILKDKILIY